MQKEAWAMTRDNALFCVTMLCDMPDAIIYAHAKGRVCFWSAAQVKRPAAG